MYSYLEIDKISNIFLLKTKYNSGVQSTLSRGGHFEDFVKFCPPLNQSAPGGHFALGGGILIIYTNFK